MSLKIVTKSILGNPGNKGKRIRKLRSALRWQVHKRTRRTPRVLRLANGARFKAYPDCVVSSGLIYADWPEYHEFHFLRRHLQKGDVVIDAGANVGHVSLLLSDIARGSENMVAFEPSPLTFGRLSENWRLNGWTTDQLFQVALGASNGVVEIADVSTPDTTVSLQWSGRSENMVQVPLARLDDYRDCWKGKRVGLLKIDVEGYEAEVFAGSEKTLQEDQPRFVMFESLSGVLDERIAVLLAKCGYEVFELNAMGQPDFTRSNAQNIFAMPRENRSPEGNL